MPGRAGKPAEHPRRRNGPDCSRRIDAVRADEELVRLGVDQPVCRRAADTAGKDSLFKVGRDLIELVRRAGRLVRRVGDYPEPTSPGYNRPDAALRFLIGTDEMRIDAGDRPDGWPFGNRWLGGRCRDQPRHRCNQYHNMEKILVLHQRGLEETVFRRLPFPGWDFITALSVPWKKPSWPIPLAAIPATSAAQTAGCRRPGTGQAPPGCRSAPCRGSTGWCHRPWSLSPRLCPAA